MFSIGSAILHFVIGGIAVALASIIADKVGGKLGGIIATMPAVFLAAIIALALTSSWYAISGDVDES